MKNKTTKKKPSKKQSAVFHHCRYCNTCTPIGVEVCGNCARKSELIHRLWLIGQKILNDAGRNNKEKEDDIYE